MTRAGEAPPLARQWEVTAYRDADGGIWRRGRDGVVIAPGGFRHSPSRALARLFAGDDDHLPADCKGVGPLVPVEVTSVAAVVREVGALRAAAEYVLDCGDEDCEELYDDEGTRVAEYCSHAERHVATRAEALALRKVRQVLAETPTDEEEGELERLRHLLARVREAATGDPGDDD